MISIYDHPAVYQVTMRLLYGANFDARYRMIAELIPEEAEVLDLCCGEGLLFRRYLRMKRVRYTGYDVSERMLKPLKRLGANVKCCDVAIIPLPRADVVILQGSLYQFLPDGVTALLERMLAAARSKVIISEPVQNLSTSPRSAVALLSRILTRPRDSSVEYSGLRFSAESFRQFVRAVPGFEREIAVTGGRDLIAVFRASKNP